MRERAYVEAKLDVRAAENEIRKQGHMLLLELMAARERQRLGEGVVVPKFPPKTLRERVDNLIKLQALLNEAIRKAEGLTE